MKTALKYAGKALMWAAAAGLLFAGISEAMIATASQAPTEAVEHALKSAASWLGFAATLLRNFGLISLTKPYPDDDPTLPLSQRRIDP